MLNRFSARARVTAFAAVAALAAAACSGDQNTPLGGEDQPALVETGSELVLERSAVREGRVAVALRLANQGEDPIAALQGVLKFNPEFLQYQGQDASDRVPAVVNAEKAAQGELRVVSFAATGFTGRAATLVFQVRQPAFEAGLRFDVEEAVTRGLKLASLRAAAGLEVKADAAPLALAAWLGLLDPSADPTFNPLAPSFLNGQYVLNLVYGNANLAGGLTTGDALIVAQVAASSRELIIGTDAPNTDPIVAGNVFPGTNANLNTVGVNANGTRSISTGDALAIAQRVAGVAPANTPVGLAIPGRGPLPSTTDTNHVAAGAIGAAGCNVVWTRNKVWALDGLVRVNNGCTLTIESGTVVAGNSTINPNALIVERDGWIIADGTFLQPIKFTCTAAIKTKGCWGGLFIAGNGTVNEQDATLPTSPAVPGRSAGGCNQFQGEGGGPAYGGCNPADSSGVLRFVISEYGGFILAANNELNGITMSGVGSATDVDFIQVHGGLDDGYEIFGGDHNLKHLYATANSDDFFDYSQGWSGKVQFVIAQMDPIDSDRGFEVDNTGTSATFGNAPRTNPTIFNTTIVGQDNPADNTNVAAQNQRAGFQMRRGTAGQVFNTIIFNTRIALDIDDAQTCVGINTATGLTMRNIILAGNQVNGDADGSDPNPCGPYAGTGTDLEALYIADAANAISVNPAGFSMRAPLHKLTPDYRPTANTTGATPPNDGFFDVTATFIGAVPATPSTTAPWYLGWTRVWQSGSTP